MSCTVCAGRFNPFSRLVWGDVILSELSELGNELHQIWGGHIPTCCFIWKPEPSKWKLRPRFSQGQFSRVWFSELGAICNKFENNIEHSSKLLVFRHIVPFRHHSASKATGSKIEAKFRPSPFVKLRGGWVNYIINFCATSMTQPLICFWRDADLLSRRYEPGWQKKFSGETITYNCRAA